MTAYAVEYSILAPVVHERLLMPIGHCWTRSNAGSVVRNLTSVSVSNRCFPLETACPKPSQMS
ncbi:hypothetical protein DV706_20400 (plasmid) [Natronorubrum bangense]|uniref:Uncharacterized protein n=2 Tax=Natronorubrum bangense TaxID=61858 RepID=L9W928_9EURY|nr:hypothetical protein C494_16283 [Natronorubrum bangense JCM 10635]QCC56893.1 hypothetical protein DV706_20400 [Natronorubrum bangense]